MAHNVETMAYAGETPWHGLGVPVSNDLSPEDMMRAAGVDWRVIKTPLVAEAPDGSKIETDKVALLRDSDNSILSVVGKDWNVIQNHEAFQFFHEFVEAGHMEMHTAGSLQDGKIVWVLAKINEAFSVFGNDTIEGYMLFTNFHDYGKATDIRNTMVRVVCNNTLNMALGSQKDKVVRISHRTKFDPDEVKTALGITKKQLDAYKEAAEFLGSKRYNDDLLKEYFMKVFPATGANKKELSRNAKKAIEIVEIQPGAEFAPGTMWNAFNAVTYLTDHELGHNDNNRLYSAWYGNNRDRKIKAMNIALEVAKAA